VPNKIEYQSVNFNLLLPTLHPLGVDEKCWSLFERDEFTADFKHLRRVQTVRVQRDGNLVEFPRDMGPASSFKANGFVIPCLFEDTVGHALDYADFMRDQGEVGLQRAMDDHREEVNVIEQAILRAEMVQEYLRRNTRTLVQARK